MIETECFKELNVLGPNNTPTPDLLINHPSSNNEDKGCFPFRRKVISCRESVIEFIDFSIHVYIAIVLYRENKALAQERCHCLKSTCWSCRKHKARSCRLADPGWTRVTAWIYRRRRRSDAAVAVDDNACPAVAACICRDESRPILRISFFLWRRRSHCQLCENETAKLA